MSQDFKIGIVGAGAIAAKIAATVGRMEGFSLYAVASRSREKAEAFAALWGVERAYGSYSDLLDDDKVDLVYIATPHSHHFDVTREALKKGRPCLVEKAFMANCREAEEIIRLSHERNVFVAEAIWTRYQPAVGIIRKLIAEGRIGRMSLISFSLCYSMLDKERVMRPELCGGALLDLGVYGLNFVRMFCGSKVLSLRSQCVKSDTGVDLSESVSMALEGGVLATIQAAANCYSSNGGTIAGTDGCLTVDNVNNPRLVRLFSADRVLREEIAVPEQITGYEYQFVACRDAIADCLLEPPQMPHSEIIYIMKQMDGLRAEWGVRFPMD